jgi:hypothetical protein
MSEALPLVALCGAALGYEGAAVLRDVDLEVGPGELIAIAGTRWQLEPRLPAQ